ncbi:hypothetical protein [Escherichia fergusonii]|uniref:hypothetical protein n=1 Tax=Escherichia fergusonii TaxID=564 RepID=UPI0006145928|nr:hypothetical protein [Escherichia fergusonii]KWV98921.1 hypothetical protein VK87_0220120 [Escherichia fergusonii]MBZ4100665.1 hypothetical protein [Escherichia fergusonii]MBZ4153499.1 hypothetical protein [Escherichia fergusonii]
MSSFNDQHENTYVASPSGQFSNTAKGLASSGEIAKTIGEGENAKNSIVWKIITYTLYMYSAIIFILCVYDLWNNNGQGCVDIIKETWSTFSPLLTLSLGYMFGKREDVGKA